LFCILYASKNQAIKTNRNKEHVKVICYSLNVTRSTKGKERVLEQQRCISRVKIDAYKRKQRVNQQPNCCISYTLIINTYSSCTRICKGDANGSLF